MASPSFHSKREAAQAQWAARLIPGISPAGGKKKPQRDSGVRVGFSNRQGDSSRPSAGDKPRALAESVGRVVDSVRSTLVWIAGLLHLSTLWLCRDLHGSGKRNVLIVGAGRLARQIAQCLSTRSDLERTFCGFLDDRKPIGNGVIGRTCDLAQLARAGFVDEVILATPHDRELTLRMLRAAQQLRLDVKLAPELFGCEPMRRPEQIGGIPLIPLHEERLPIVGLLLKRFLDVSVAGAMLILLAPAMGLLAILIKLDSPGPVFYSAPRAGRKGKPFLCHKFRSMVKDADGLKDGLRECNQRQGPFFKIADDPRITRVGRFLRRYSLDELPQLWNVLKGEMSLVGPRPHPIDDFSFYSIEHLPRLDVTPGITGLWQVTARGDPSFQAGMKLDLEYIHRWGLRLDFEILLKTAGAILRGSGE
jgi:exopolysaccharide biosynthesis polyprenyl glycosylphosphotransferase